MKKILLMLVVAALFVSANLFAKNLPGDIAGARADYLYKKLKLTNEQYNTVYSIFLDAAMKMKGMDMKKMTKDAMNEQMKKTHDETMSKIEKILTKDQLTLWPKEKEKVCKVKTKKIVKKTKTDSKEEVKKDEKKEETKK